MRLGAILRADNSGLGTLSREFSDHIGFERTIVLDNGKYQAFPERFPGGRVVSRMRHEDVDWMLSGIDALLAFETPYDWDIFKLARKRGVRTILMPMYECEPYPLPAFPDHILCPSKLDYDIFKQEVAGRAQVWYIPVPVNRQRVPFQPRQIAKVFQHNAGHGGIIGRNGTTELLAAIPMLKSKAKVVIYSQKRIDFDHPQCEIRVGNFKDYWQIWGGGDVFVFPHKFDGLSLPINEALSSGMPILSTAIYPFTLSLPKHWFFNAQEFMNIRAWDRFVDVAVIDPAVIAAKIDEWFDKPIGRDSRIASGLADKISWQMLKPKYIQLFQQICKQKTASSAGPDS